MFIIVIYCAGVFFFWVKYCKWLRLKVIALALFRSNFSLYAILSEENWNLANDSKFKRKSHFMLTYLKIKKKNFNLSHSRPS